MMIPYALRILLAITALVLPLTGAQAQGDNTVKPRFFETLNDVPLMPGLDEILDRSMVFDKPGGRIAESVATGNDEDMKKIHDFYEQTLPQLGWQKTADGTYVREDEQLRMTLTQEEGMDVVTFHLEPR